MNMKYFKIKHIALLLAVTSAPLYTAYGLQRNRLLFKATNSG
mgnify:CR=1 FL=1